MNIALVKRDGDRKEGLILGAEPFVAERVVVYEGQLALCLAGQIREQQFAYAVQRLSMGDGAQHIFGCMETNAQQWLLVGTVGQSGMQAGGEILVPQQRATVNQPGLSLIYNWGWRPGLADDILSATGTPLEILGDLFSREKEAVLLKPRSAYWFSLAPNSEPDLIQIDHADPDSIFDLLANKTEVVDSSEDFLRSTSLARRCYEQICIVPGIGDTREGVANGYLALSKDPTNSLVALWTLIGSISINQRVNEALNRLLLTLDPDEPRRARPKAKTLLLSVASPPSGLGVSASVLAKDLANTL